MNLEFGKFKILCINIFLILLKAALLNPYQLQAELQEVDFILQNNCNLCHRFLVIFICLYLELKFIMGYITLAANIIAIFPILTAQLPHLLLPALIAQTIDHIGLNFFEIILGFCTTKIIAIHNMSVFVILVLNNLFKISFAITALNIYSDYYQQLKCIPLQLVQSKCCIMSQEKFIKLETLQ
ncbi:uncharacterized protein LOC124419345 [Lucilia cuprina]|uniref:uncharacterized protein LOC124419345 n=1 Tax=Lucilia cuprina TaxID=7375 RepID=UPI001F0624F8|nr:uncharacterized protein LOC124419345 [Lucilia cuprina]